MTSQKRFDREIRLAPIVLEAMKEYRIRFFCYCWGRGWDAGGGLLLILTEKVHNSPGSCIVLAWLTISCRDEAIQKVDSLAPCCALAPLV